MKAIAEQDAKKAKKVFHRRRLKYLANYDTADILNHFKSQKKRRNSKESIVQDFYEKDIISRVLPYKN